MIERIVKRAGGDGMQGTEFRRLRESAGLNQTDCGIVFGMPQSSVSRIECKGLKRGAQAYRLAFAFLIAEATNGNGGAARGE